MSTSWPPPAPPARAGAPRWAIALIAAVTALLMVVGVFIVLTLTGGAASASEVTREPVNTAGANPFMPAVGADAEQVSSPTGTGGTFRGDTPGLYGGTRDDRACDAAELTGFLSSHPAQAAAWAGVLGIRTSEIDSYVSTLTPVLLRSDTLVTNHGYRDGRATVVSSVLQAGTAVFVDRYGSPAVRCYCGNPLTAPTLVSSPAYVGPTWVSFNQTTITIVQNTTTVVNDYTIVDPWRNAPFVRTPGYEPGFTPKRDDDYTGAPLPSPGQSGRPGSPGTSGSPSDPGTPFDPMDATCPDGTSVRSGGTLEESSRTDLDGDGQDETAVLVRCGDRQQVAVHARDGSVVATLPTPTPPPGSSGTPLYDDNRFVLTPESLTIDMKVYGPNDTDGNPTVRQAWRWDWDGAAFTLAQDTVAPVEAPAADTPIEPEPDPSLTGDDPFSAEQAPPTTTTETSTAAPADTGS